MAGVLEGPQQVDTGTCAKCNRPLDDHEGFTRDLNKGLKSVWPNVICPEKKAL